MSMWMGFIRMEIIIRQLTDMRIPSDAKKQIKNLIR